MEALKMGVDILNKKMVSARGIHIAENGGVAIIREGGKYRGIAIKNVDGVWELCQLSWLDHRNVHLCGAGN